MQGNISKYNYFLNYRNTSIDFDIYPKLKHESVKRIVTDVTRCKGRCCALSIVFVPDCAARRKHYYLGIDSVDCGNIALFYVIKNLVYEAVICLITPYYSEEASAVAES